MNKKIKAEYNYLSSRIYNLKGIFKKKLTPEQTKQYWENPKDEGNFPINYYEDNIDKCKELINILNKYVNKDKKILELGCNVGRNLNYLYQNGYKNIAGVEINKQAINLSREKYHLPIMIYNADLTKFDTKGFDIIYSMAVLQHISNKEIKQVFDKFEAEFLILIEDKAGIGERHFIHNYEKLTKSKYDLIEKKKGIEGLPKGFIAYIFKKKRGL